MYTTSPFLSRAASSSPATSHQSGVIKEHWNDLPASMVSRSLNSTPLRSLSSTPLSSAASSCPDTDTDTDADADASEFLAALEALFAGTPTTLGSRERKLLQGRVLKSLADITAPQKREVAQIVTRLLHERSLSKKAAKDAVVAFMMRERGVAGWAGGVRRGVESVVLE